MSKSEVVTLDNGAEDKIKEMFGGNQAGWFSLIIDGRRIPKITVRDSGDIIEFLVDGRFCYDVKRKYSLQFGAAISTALAVGMGYPSIQSDAPIRVFAPKVMVLDEVPQ